MITSSTQLSSGSLRRYIESTAFDQFVKSTFFYKGGEQRTLAKGDHTYAFNVMDRTTFTAAQAKLVEGVTPSDRGITYSQVDVTADQYGVFAIITDVAEQDAPIDIYTKAAKELGRQMAEIVDQVVQAELLASGTTAIYGGAITSRAAITSTTYAAAKDLAKAYSILKAKAAPFYTGGSADGNSNGETGTGAGATGYIGVFHPFVIHDIKTENTVNGGFIDATKYSQPENIFNGEIGKFNGIRIIESPNITSFLGGVGGTVVIYPSFILGADAYGVVVSQQMETIIKPRTAGGVENALNQRGSVGMKVRFGTKIIKDESLVRLETTSSLAATTLPY